VPIDFDAYSIPDKLTQGKGPIPDDEKIWRISSMTAAVDDDTKILILPLPESKREVKIAQTKYVTETIEQLIQKSEEIRSSLQSGSKEIKRFQDMTQDEMEEAQ
jgi:hypothetical protein